MKRIVLSLTLAACAASLQAADKDGAYWSQRADNCREFVRVHPTGERRPETVGVRNWVAGYITAYNRQTPETYDISGIADFEQVLLSVEKFCKANPLADLGAAMEAVTEELRSTRHQTRRQAGR
jgi:hypothetical protein